MQAISNRVLISALHRHFQSESQHYNPAGQSVTQSFSNQPATNQSISHPHNEPAVSNTISLALHTRYFLCINFADCFCLSVEQTVVAFVPMLNLSHTGTHGQRTGTGSQCIGTKRPPGAIGSSGQQQHSSSRLQAGSRRTQATAAAAAGTQDGSSIAQQYNCHRLFAIL